MTVKDGENAASVDADKVAALFEASRQIGDWTESSRLPLTIRAKGKEGSDLLFDATIKSESDTCAFLRLGRGDAIVAEPEETDNGGEEVVVPEEEGSGAKYLVVDLSAGEDASSYPVTYLDEAPNGGFNTDEYKTTKLVLRRIEAGTFTMGDSDVDGNLPHQVTLTKAYYMGVFEVTQKQYALVTGSNPSRFAGDKQPAENVSWNTIRGNSETYNWPNSSTVDVNSFIGRIQKRTGLAFDLPTEAQWEYACRAGTTTAYSFGDNNAWYYMWYEDNSPGRTAEVGMTQPNPWGLYDMHGNVYEWCLDWGEEELGTEGATDPKGASSGSERVVRGGSWDECASNSQSAKRGDCSPSHAYHWLGFRLSGILTK